MLGKAHAILTMIFLEVCLLLISYELLILGLWLPLIPSTLAIIITPLIIWVGEINFKEWEKRLNHRLIREVNS